MEVDPVSKEIAGLRTQFAHLGTRLAWIAVFLLLLVASRVYATISTSAPSLTELRFEYRVESFSDEDWNSKSEGPNRMGAEGWEIVFARRTESDAHHGYECILRRRK